ncbi:MAG: GGDEF domain-containing protein [Deltaproteobacteria bacterium]|nr:GGDEF domain-containing protein [Deltaproteobacteria bacterium]
MTPPNPSTPEDARRAAGLALAGALLAGLVALALAQARLLGDAWTRTLPFPAALLFLAAGLAAWRLDPARAPGWREAALGAGVLGLQAALRLLHGPTWPALLVVALGVASALALRGQEGTARLLAVAAFVSEALVALGPRQDLPSVLAMACAAGAVPLLVDASVRSWREGLVEQARHAVDRRLRELDQDARDYRLIGATTRTDLALPEAEQRRTRGSVNAVRETMHGLVELCARVMDPHTCVLLWLDDGGTSLRVAELVTRSDFLVLEGLAADKGVPGTVLKKRAPLALHNIGADFGGVTWYHPPQAVRALVAVPVLEGEHPRGVLLCDWLTDRVTTERDTVVLSQVAREIVRAMENERAFGGVDQERRLEGMLFRASQDFVRAVTVPETLQVMLGAARQVTGASAALLLAREGAVHRVVVADGFPNGTAGREVPATAGLRAVLDGPRQGTDVAGADRVRALLGAGIAGEGFPAARLFPFHDEQGLHGALVLLGARSGAFALLPDDRVQTVLALGGLAVTNRRLFEKMERMATTDGLTGLVNHRTFQDRFAEALKRAQRYQHPIGVILTDIDHFKNVNDTYGHPVGDEVIRQVAGVLRQVARTTDIVARYGGEEFAVVMEETDAEGGLAVAERIRQSVQAIVVETEMGPLKVTLSLGVAAWPTHGAEKHHLIERADQALYTAKHSGRNRAVIGTPVTPAPPQAAPAPEKA